MGTPIRVLIVEDSEDDTLLLLDQLRENGYDPAHRRIETEQAMGEALQEQEWDVIIADYTLPSFSGPAALEVLRKSGLDIPFILVSGTMPEDAAVEVMRAGAQDFILKHNLSRFAPALARELHEAKIRVQRKRAEEQLQESEKRFRAITETASDGIITVDEDDKILYANPALGAILGYEPKEMVGQSVVALMPEEDRQKHIATMRLFREAGCSTSGKCADYSGLHRDGRRVPIEVSFSASYADGRCIITGIVRDVTERKREEQREKELDAHKREFYRLTILSATEGKLLISDAEEIAAITGPAIASWEIRLASDVGTIRAAVAESVCERGMANSRIDDLVLCVGESASNAFKHAGGGIASLHQVGDALFFVVSDKGPGIAALALPELALKRGYTTAGTLGMGYKMMISLADRVLLATQPGGTTVAIEMRLQEPQRPAESGILGGLACADWGCR